MQGREDSIQLQILTPSWFRRLCGTSLTINVVLLLLYAWVKLAPVKYQLPAELVIHDIVAIVALVAGLLSLIFLIIGPKKHIKIFSTIIYASLLALVVTLALTAYSSGLILVSIWVIVAFLAGLFSNVVIGLVIALAIAFGMFEFFQRDLAIQVAIVNISLSLLPIIAGYLLWHQQSGEKMKNSLASLARKLSTVEGKSDVVINAIDDGVVTINRSGIIDLINPAAQTLVGWDQGDALGLDWRSVLKLVNVEGRDLAESENPIYQSLVQNESIHSDIFFLQTGSGKKRLVSIVSSPINQSSSEGVIVVFRDITKEKAEEREQAEFISTASHEMRTPVASIEGYLGLAINPNTATIDDRAREYLGKAHEASQHLGRLFQDLLDVSKAEDGRLKNEPQIIDVSAMTGDIFESLMHLAEGKNLRLLFRPNPSLETNSTDRRMQPVFYADVDPNHFREVVANLIENAIKYTPEGDVVVDVNGDDKIITVSVQDTGIGIPHEDIPHLFQKFYRVDNSDTREIGGTGLGLYLSRRLAESMGGNLRVESEYQKGSTFFLDIPRTNYEEAMRRLDQVSEKPDIVVENRSSLSKQTTNNGDQLVNMMENAPISPTEPTPTVAETPIPQDPPPSVTSPQAPPITPPQPVATPPQPTAPTAPPQAPPVAPDQISPASNDTTPQQRPDSLNVPPR